MAYFNTSPSTSRAVLQVATATILSTTTGFVVPALQDITVNNGTAVFNWTQLDSFGQQSLPTPATNSVSGNLVVDPTTYFGDGSTTSGVPGLHSLSNNATKVFWRVYFDGQKAGSRFISGSGYVTGLAPSTNPTAPVFVTPFTIAADGEIATSTV